MQIIFDAARANQFQLYLIINEYDNFTNVVLNGHGEKVYHAITHADGFYRDVFKKFKGNFERIFMMGISPVTLDDVTSGYNVGWNISVKPEFDEMLGFSTKDVVERFTYYKEMGSIPADSDVDAIVNDMNLGTTTIALQKKHWIRVSECLIAIWCFTIFAIIWITDALLGR